MPKELARTGTLAADIGNKDMAEYLFWHQKQVLYHYY